MTARDSRHAAPSASEAAAPSLPRPADAVADACRAERAKGAYRMLSAAVRAAVIVGAKLDHEPDTVAEGQRLMAALAPWTAAFSDLFRLFTLQLANFEFGTLVGGSAPPWAPWRAPVLRDALWRRRTIRQTEGFLRPPLPPRDAVRRFEARLATFLDAVPGSEGCVVFLRAEQGRARHPRTVPAPDPRAWIEFVETPLTVDLGPMPCPPFLQLRRDLGGWLGGVDRLVLSLRQTRSLTGHERAAALRLP